jgi:hypothetical protein
MSILWASKLKKNMLEKENRENWQKLIEFIKLKFSDGEEPDLDSILFLIGVRELGINKQRFKKDEKLDILHIAICRLLVPYGYYKLVGSDEQGWPHYELVEKLPHLKAGEQSILMKEAILRYFEEEEILVL